MTMSKIAGESEGVYGERDFQRRKVVLLASVGRRTGGSLMRKNSYDRMNTYN
jgi:hypothetical protein